MSADTNGTLFERPNVRVRAVPAIMCPARESAAGGRETPGAFESRLPVLTAAPLGVHFLCRERKCTKKILRYARRTLQSGQDHGGHVS